MDNMPSYKLLDNQGNLLTEQFEARVQAEKATFSLPACPRPRFSACLLFLSDSFAVLLSCFVAAVLWLNLSGAGDLSGFIGLWPLLALLPLGYWLAGLYPGAGMGPIEELRRLTLISVSVYLIVVLEMFLMQNGVAQPRGIFLLSLVATLVFVPTARGLLRTFVAEKPWWGVPVLVLGAGKTGRLLVKRLRRQADYGFKVIACLDDDSSKHGHHPDITVYGPLSEAPYLAKRLNINHVLIAMPGLHPNELRPILSRYARTFRNVLVVPNLFGLSSLGLSTHDLGGMVSIHAKQNLLLPFNRFVKRFLDLVLVLPLLILALPIIALAALWIMIISRGKGSPFYAQEREGYKGKRIKVWKMRTMYPNAEELLKEHLKTHPKSKTEWETFYKLKDDPRILPGIGSLLRKTSLDELPQLWNILRGDMSLVGPRPFPYYHLECFNDEFRTLRCSVLPGLTGLWQVSARADGDIALQEELDSYYIRNWSPWLDIYLLAHTPKAVLLGKGAY
jgi:Undecaprenyl-phosphate galactose phosphotransferase WbaP